MKMFDKIKMNEFDKSEINRKKVIFLLGQQRKFLIDLKEKLNTSLRSLSEIANYHLNRCATEKTTLPLKALLSLCDFVGYDYKKVLKQYRGKIVDKGIPRPCTFGTSKIKIKPIFITYPSLSLRLDSSFITLNHWDQKKNIVLPTSLTPQLAEEIGMHCGDGFLSSKKNDFRIKGHKIDEKSYYEIHIRDLYKKIYNLNVNVREYSDTIGIEIYSKALKEFKVKVLGIKSGRKDNLQIPECIKVDNISILTSFIRGFFDTDGSVYFIQRKGLKIYPRLSITQKSKLIVEETFEILSMLGFSPKLYTHKDGYTEVVLYGYSQLHHYEKIIGWNSPKHLKKVKKWKEVLMATVV
jgi:hypothetical protein